RLFGSAQTRIDGRALATVLDARAPSMTATAASMHITAAAVRLREREDIQHASLLRSGRQVAHGVHEPERRGRVARVQIARDDGARPSPYSGQDRDVLPPVRSAVRHRLADYSGAAAELPEHFSIARVDGLEPAVHGSVERDVAGGDERAAPHGQILADAPRGLAFHDVP